MRSQRLARSAMWIRKHQQHASPAQLIERKLAVSVHSRQVKLRRGRPGPQAITLDFASGQRAVAEASAAVISIPRSSRRKEALIHSWLRASDFGVSRINLVTLAATELMIWLPEFQLVEPLFQFIKAQKHSAILAQQLPTEPAAGQ